MTDTREYLMNEVQDIALFELNDDIVNLQQEKKAVERSIRDKESQFMFLAISAFQYLSSEKLCEFLKGCQEKNS